MTFVLRLGLVMYFRIYPDFLLIMFINLLQIFRYIIKTFLCQWQRSREVLLVPFVLS